MHRGLVRRVHRRLVRRVDRRRRGLVATGRVAAVVPERRVQQTDDIDGVAARVDRNVHRNLDEVAGQHTGGAGRDALGARALALAAALAAHVRALVAERGVQQTDHVDGVAAHIDRHMYRHLHGVARADAGRPDGRAVGGGIRERVATGGGQDP